MAERDTAQRVRQGWVARAFYVWAAVALVSLVPLALLLDAAIPILTVVWIVVPVVVVARAGDASRVGIRTVPVRLVLETAALYLVIAFAVALLVEPWSHTYERVIELATTTRPIDSTFAWLVRYPGLAGIAGMTVYSAVITMFGEELFFRGWLLQYFRPRIGSARAVVLQAGLFAIPQMIVAAFMSPLQAIVYVTLLFVPIRRRRGWMGGRPDQQHLAKPHRRHGDQHDLGRAPHMRFGNIPPAKKLGRRPPHARRGTKKDS